MVFDESGRHLYVSTSDGFVRRYNIAAGEFDAAYNLGGSLYGLDIAPGDSFLLVAQGSTTGTVGTFHRLDLSNGNVTDLTYTRASRETGGWDAAIGSNNIALITTQAAETSLLPLRQIDLATNTVSVRTDATAMRWDATVTSRMPIARSADRTRMYFRDVHFSLSTVFTYSATTNKFGPAGQSQRSVSIASIAVDRTGSVIATPIGQSAALDRAPSLDYLRTFNVDGGLAFDATRDRFYGVSTAAKQIIAYDATTCAELYRLDIGETLPVNPTQFGSGDLVASNDGRFLALATSGGIRLFTLPAGPYAARQPTFSSPQDMVFDRKGHRLYIAAAEGLVWPYNLSTRSLEKPFALGGSLSAIDIASDDSFLLVGQAAAGTAGGAVHKLDLATGAVTNFNYSRDGGEGGVSSVRIASNGLAFVTTNYIGSGSTPLREINLSTGATRIRNDLPTHFSSAGDSTDIRSSADRTRLCFYYYNGYLFTYSAVTDSFGPVALQGENLNAASVALNRNGSLVATRRPYHDASLHTVPNYSFVRSFDLLDYSVAFDGQSDVLYGTAGSGEIIAYDTNTFAELFRLKNSDGVAVGPADLLSYSGNGMVASPDGYHLASGDSGVLRVHRLPAAAALDLRVTSVDMSGTAPRIDFTTTAARSYRVEYKNALTEQEWNPVMEAENVSGTGGIVRVSDPEPGARNLPKRFYRVVLLPR